MNRERVGNLDLSNTSLMVVEDNVSTQKVLHKLLEKVGAREIRFASDGSQALQALSNWVPDVILTDWKMSPVNGAQFLTSLKKDPGVLSTVPVVVITGISDKAALKKILDLGPDQLVLKPIVPARLYNRLNWVLQKHAARAGSAGKRAVQPDDPDGPEETWLL